MNVLYEDNHLLVVVKPYNVLSQADASGDCDMLSMCKQYIAKKYSKPGSVYLGLVHRLDRPTGGVMLFARTSKAASRISAQIRQGSFEKTYLCVLTSPPPQNCGTLRHHLVKDKKARISRVSDSSDAKESELSYTVLSKSKGYYLVQVFLKTGRFHQIRSQFAAVGAPIYGDQKYNRDAKISPLALYSHKLCFSHPTTKDRLCFSSNPTLFPFTLFDIT